MQIDIDQIKVWGFNLTTLVVSFSDLASSVLSMIGAGLAVVYTGYKIRLLHLEQKQKAIQDE
ncbi:hypothetical protein [Croceimicrobium hydrocarbonivorans]|uniref:Uncharacterized protein n=1 Tax=Croceimicrobium hydrocarbonivorans TaxID=2761580 RepID=A0A7H0VBB7_9FLAO|nr:hypothetical protein [Croceimicrobium hydrocarbonivorans]QNR22970.1 hypothetical protein H4K34_11330 [Croceimicrobium hydrocarbonivorans]QNR23015.1 hypothetical protein H4K34_11555 [Croceimicrobium hydrocarbonivorans]